ncbi:DUF7453 family protein [Adhaeretor mobilis]|uniref:PEP-CTERM protein-sorting domain-containing protein n=1 Tax=Adhaeretor mobilis TaxID=1930276 RepID=A0A517MXX8_9BACT|nr:choice-of-anchor tandem repeat NxxGxxAF-containing protein [Adhaeretor mobilis]QDS99742.1 hypothetical protein HG15A2_30720 [Adhaeretor mobilis]
MVLKCFAFGFACIACLVHLSTNLAAAEALRIVALAGDESSGNAIESLGVPSLNGSGQSAFYAELFTASNRTSLLIERSAGSLTVVAQHGDTGPGEGVTIDDVRASQSSSPPLNNAGVTAFAAGLFGPGVGLFNRDAVLRDSGGALELVAPSGDAVPGAEVGFDFIPSLHLNNSGQAAFMAELFGTSVDQSNDFGVFREDAVGELATVAREGDFLPQSSLQFFFPATARGLWTVSLNDRGQTAFAGLLTGRGAGAGNNLAIFSEGNGNGVEIVARSGSTAPSLPDGEQFSRFGIPKLNNLGHSAFFAELAGASVTESTDYGLFRTTASGDTVIVARDGGAAPDMPEAVVFDFNYTVVRGGFGEEGPSFNDVDQTAFIASLTGTDPVSGFANQGIFRGESDGELHLVARSGEEAPGRSDGAYLRDFSQLALNDNGQIAVLASLEIDDSFGGRSILAQDTAGILHTIASTGDELNLSNDPSQLDLSTVERLSFAGDAAWNARGQIAFKAEFTDGTSGVFISNLVAVPEPASWTLLGGLLLVVNWRMKRRKLRG